jgi:hypothetical protein
LTSRMTPISDMQPPNSAPKVGHIRLILHG